MEIILYQTMFSNLFEGIGIVPSWTYLSQNILRRPRVANVADVIKQASKT